MIAVADHGAHTHRLGTERRGHFDFNRLPRIELDRDEHGHAAFVECGGAAKDLGRLLNSGQNHAHGKVELVSPPAASGGVVEARGLDRGSHEFLSSEAILRQPEAGAKVTSVRRGVSRCAKGHVLAIDLPGHSPYSADTHSKFGYRMMKRDASPAKQSTAGAEARLSPAAPHAAGLICVNPVSGGG